MTEKDNNHIGEQYKRARKIRVRVVVLSILLTAIGSGLATFFVPIKPNNVLYQLNSHHHYIYPENLVVENSNEHYFSTITDPSGDLKVTVKSYFLVGGATVNDLLNQFYSTHFQVEKDYHNSTFQFQDDYLSLRKDDDVITAFEYNKAHFDKVIDFIGEEYPAVFIEKGLQNFTASQYRDILDHVVYKDALPIDVPQDIFGDREVDRYFRKVAYDRGYRQRVAVESGNLGTVEGFEVSDYAEDELKMILEDVRNAGHDVNILSIYRSIEDQRKLFTRRYGGSLDNAIVTSGQSDDDINQTLDVTAPPGMSKHHSSNTIDFAENGVYFTLFKNTESFKWFSENDYANAKKYGFVPSYPEDAVLQGPKPEAYEYTYVGKTILTK